VSIREKNEWSRGRNLRFGLTFLSGKRYEDFPSSSDFGPMRPRQREIRKIPCSRIVWTANGCGDLRQIRL